MSLTKTVKNEILLSLNSGCCKNAFLSGFVHTAATVSFKADGMSFSAPTIDCDSALLIKELFLLRYNGVFDVTGDKIFITQNAPAVLTGLGIFKKGEGGLELIEGIDLSLVKSACCKKAYIKGAFFGCGSLTLPKSGYNLEFNMASFALAADIKELFALFGIKATCAQGKAKSRVYIRGKDYVSDALALMNASKSVIELNSLIAQRDLRKLSSSRANCDMANVEKTVAASMLQLKAINALSLKDPKLIEVAEARKRYPDGTYEELKDILGVSKSTVKYRLNKIVEMYKGKP